MSIRRQMCFAALLIALPLPVAAQLICSFEDEADLAVVSPGGLKAERVKQHATDGEYSLKCFFPGSEKDTWPGLSFRPKDTDLSKYQVLAFDVFNPTDGHVGLSWRIDDGNGKNVFAGQGIPPGKVTTVEIYLSGLASQLDVANVTNVYPYLRMPRDDATLYFDNFRFMEMDLRFTPLVYEETATPVAPTAEDKRRGYQVFSRHWLDVVFPSSRPRPGEADPTLKAFGCPGEYEPVTFSVHALQALSNARVTVSNLTCGEATVPGDSVTVYPVRCLNKRVTYSSGEYIQDMPVLLERVAQTEIAAGASRRFWLDIRVPDDATPGIYRGTATFSAEGVLATDVPLMLRVLPLKLQEPTDMIWGEYYTGPKLAATPEEERTFVERDLRDMRAHGMTSVGLCIGVPFAQAKLAGDGVELNLDGSSLYEHFMDLYRDLGFPAPVVQLSDSGQSFAGAHTFMSDEYKQAYKGFWIAVQAECKKRGWPEIIVQPVDEPGWQGQEHKDRNVALLKLLKEIPGMRTEQDGPGDAYFHGEAGPHADVWNYNGGLAAPEVVAEAQENGHLVMLYNCDVESYRPEVGRYVSGFFQKRAGTSGCYNWSYMSWKGQPYDDLDHKTGTWMHVYPPYKGEPGGPSIGWQGFREGIDDYKYLHTLGAALARAEGSGKAQAISAAKQAGARLDSLVDTISYSPGVRNSARWTRTRPGEVGKLISGTLKVPNGWDFETYDIARWQAAESTLAIMAALGEVERQPTTQPEPAQQLGPLLSQISWTTAPERQQAAPVATHQLTIPILQAAPKIDGDLGDAAWKQAAKVDGFAPMTGKGKLQQQTHAWLLADDANLYLAFECLEDKLDYLTANVSKDGGPVWQDDCVEIFLDSNRDQSTYRQIGVNNLGTQAWNSPDDPKWRAKSEAAARVGKAAWYAEVRLPLADLDLVSTTFGLNLCRERRPMEVMELSCWSPTGASFGRPERFGVATLGTASFSNVRLGLGVLGTNTLRATVTNPLHGEATLHTTLRCAQGDTEPTTTRTQAIDFAPRESREVTLTYVVSRDDAPVSLALALTHPDDGKEVASLPLTQGVQPALSLSVHPRMSTMDREFVAVQAQVALGADLTEKTRLRVALLDSTGRSLREQTVADLGGNGMSASLNLSGLADGSYTVSASLSPRADAAAPLATREVGLVRVRGPFR